jgi:hypothetical protein
MKWRASFGCDNVVTFVIASLFAAAFSALLLAVNYAAAFLPRALPGS